MGLPCTVVGGIEGNFPIRIAKIVFSIAVRMAEPCCLKPEQRITQLTSKGKLGAEKSTIEPQVRLLPVDDGAGGKK